MEAIAQGNTLGKGPWLFELFHEGIAHVREQAAGAPIVSVDPL